MAAWYSLRTAPELIALLDRIVEQNPHSSEEKLFGYALQKSPELRGAIKEALAGGMTRAQAKYAIANAISGLTHNRPARA